MKWRRFWTVFGGVLLFSLSASGQSTARQWAPTVGVTLGAPRPSYSPLDAHGLAGVQLGAEVSVGPLQVRPSAWLLERIPGADDLSICIRAVRTTTGTTCFEPTYSRRYFGLSTDLLLTAPPLGPVYLLTGAGWTALHGGTVQPSSRPLPSQRALWRVGAGVRLGRSVRAPRLEGSTTEFARAAGTARRLVAIQLWLQ